MAKSTKVTAANGGQRSTREVNTRRREAIKVMAMRDNTGRFTAPDADNDKAKRGGKAGKNSSGGPK